MTRDDVEAVAIRAGCNAIYSILAAHGSTKCRYPGCRCTAVPTAVKAAIAALLSRGYREPEETIATP